MTSLIFNPKILKVKVIFRQKYFALNITFTFSDIGYISKTYEPILMKPFVKQHLWPQNLKVKVILGLL